jgi:hypothetical protein
MPRLLRMPCHWPPASISTSTSNSCPAPPDYQELGKAEGCSQQDGDLHHVLPPARGDGSQGQVAHAIQETHLHIQKPNTRLLDVKKWTDCIVATQLLAAACSVVAQNSAKVCLLATLWQLVLCCCVTHRQDEEDKGPAIRSAHPCTRSSHELLGA